MYDLYIANKNYSSWSLRPWVLMKALGIPFREHLTPFTDDNATTRAAFLKFSPSGKVPCLHDGETIVWDSLAIAEYLAERHPGVWPADPAARNWARCASAEMHSGFPAIRDICAMNCGIRVKLAAISAPLQAELERLSQLWNEGLEQFGGPFLAGNSFTSVDAFFAPVIYRVQSYGLPLDHTSSAYVDYLLKQPAMQEWYEAAIAETTRRARYEDEARANGEVIADERVPPA